MSEGTTLPRHDGFTPTINGDVLQLDADEERARLTTSVILPILYVIMTGTVRCLNR